MFSLYYTVSSESEVQPGYNCFRLFRRGADSGNSDVKDGASAARAHLLAPWVRDIFQILNSVEQILCHDNFCDRYYPRARPDLRISQENIAACSTRPDST